MEIPTWLFAALRTLNDLLPPVEIAITLGVVFFGLSRIRRGRIVSLPASGRRSRELTGIGIGGSLTVLVVATATSWIATLDPTQQMWLGWWLRPLPLLAAAGVIAVSWFALRREPLPAPGERAISPRRRWWAFAPLPALWLTTAAAGMLLFVSVWHSMMGVSAPAGANRYGIGPVIDPGAAGLPVYMPAPDDNGYIWGAGWPNHLATVLVMLVAATALVLVLSSDANRPVFARSTAPGVREERSITARLLVCIALGGVLLTLGAALAHIGFVGEMIVGIHNEGEEQEAVARFYVGTGYSDFAPLMHKGGYLVQGIGAALLLRLAVDTWRAREARNRDRARDPEEPAPGDAAGSAEPGNAAAGSVPSGSTPVGSGTDSDTVSGNGVASETVR
ncbi:hypothetical protein [Leucobacter ruminantium]|uniref:Uncharacterized protein n=1 Tax=Leucobacter ruminantium TaxID=1289170 RepID=A0A939LU91_9MICO|nr:hypothetical protein [Leucobacter ruminantium]MBO1804929.1 hypothetical protein [Leucobacter ruminantium]